MVNFKISLGGTNAMSDDRIIVKDFARIVIHSEI